jgi:hypothetical protein
MDEAEWLQSDKPLAMLRSLGDRVNPRHLRLVAVACCRRIWQMTTDESSRYAVELAERSVDEPISEEELDAASGGAEEAFEDSLTDDQGNNVGEDDPGPAAAEAASYASSPGLLLLDPHLAVVVGNTSMVSPHGPTQESAVQANLIRDIIGNPFRPASIDPSWLTTVQALAEAAYVNRSLPAGTLDNARLAILADALEEAGRTNAAILDHLRDRATVHVRGCWALDALLGKS